MRIPTILLGAAAAGLLLPGVAVAAEAFATAELNLRAGPGPDYPVVGSIPVDGAVDILGCTESTLWCDVRTADSRGFAYARYLAFEDSGLRVALPEAVAKAELPRVTYEAGRYFDENYRDRPIYQQRQVFVDQTGATTARGATAVTGAAGGALAGALIGGPIGAAIGGVAGLAIGGAAAPPVAVRDYVLSAPADPILLDGEVVVGAGVPEMVVLGEVPDYGYRYALINGQRVLVDPATRQIVYVYR